MKDNLPKIIKYKRNTVPNRESLIKLYDDAGWVAYTSQPEKLLAGFKNSLAVYTAFEGNELVGLIRIIGDGNTIIYIQDILVLTKFRNQGIGKNLMKMAVDDFSHVRQMVLLTDDNSNTNGFYTSCGFTPADTTGCRAYLKLKGE